MYTVTSASIKQNDEIMGFLSERLTQNAWLIDSTYSALRHPAPGAGPEQVVLCHQAGALLGVAHVVRGIRRGPGWNPPYDYHVEVDALCPEAAEAIESTVWDGTHGPP